MKRLRTSQLGYILIIDITNWQMLDIEMILQQIESKPETKI